MRERDANERERERGGEVENEKSEKHRQEMHKMIPDLNNEKWYNKSVYHRFLFYFEMVRLYMYVRT